MGIESFFNSIQENSITNLDNEFTQKLTKKIQANYLYVDFNSIIHIMSTKVVTDCNYLLYKIILGTYKQDKQSQFIIKSYNLDVPNNITYQNFNKSIKDNLNEIVIDVVLKYVVNMLQNFIVANDLTTLYIAIDGVPSKSKMMEQRKRRYMGFVISELKKRILSKYQNDVMKDASRYNFEMYRISFNKSLISPATDFMDQLTTRLTDKNFINTLKSICPNIKSYYCSSAYTPNEGEKKIVDHIRSLPVDKLGNYVIYSPDSDMTLLALLLNIKFSPANQTKIQNLKVLRHNQQNDNYDVVNIDKLSNNLFSYVKSIIKFNLDKDKVVDDIVFLLLLFGNDFVPKMESFNVRNDFNLIINRYCEILKQGMVDNQVRYIIKYDNDVKIKYVDQKMLTLTVKILQNDEGGNLQRTYMATHYQNYSKLKKLMNAEGENFTYVMNEFLFTLNNLHNDIRKYLNDKNRIMLQYGDKKDFVFKLRALTRLGVDVANYTNQEFLQEYIRYYQETKKFPKVRITFRKFSRNLEDPHHMTNLEKTLDFIDPTMRITKYDEEVYKLEHMLDEYKIKLNAFELELGHIWIDHKTYKWRAEKITKGVKRYYADYFGISGDVDLRNNKHLYEVVEDYLRGALWVFDYYDNRYDQKENYEFADTWVYPHHKAPLLTQIYHLLKENQSNTNYIRDIINNLPKYSIDRPGYFNSIEHLLYVTPANVMPNAIPAEYRDFVSNSDYYVDLIKVIDTIWNQETNNEIDCRGVMFLNKCIIKSIDKIMISDEEFIKSVRKLNITSSKTLQEPDPITFNF